MPPRSPSAAPPEAPRRSPPPLANARPRRAPWLGPALAGALALGAPSCGGDDDDGPSGGGPVAADAFVSRYASAACRAIGPCCAGNGYGYEPGTCQTAVEGLLLALVVNPAKARGAAYDEARAGACVAALERQAGSCVESGDDDDAGRACERVYETGTKAPGEPCADVDECLGSPEGRAACLPAASPPGSPPAGAGRVCQIELDAARAGDPCEAAAAAPWAFASCDDGDGPLRCDRATRTCQPRLAPGAPCGADPFGCERDAHCADAGGGERACAARLPAGSPCTSGDACARDAFCDDGARLCAPKRPAGEACASGDECAGGECENGRCLANPIGSAAFCSPG